MVTRALETFADTGGSASPGHGWTNLVLGPDRPVRVVDGLITGWHAPGASHLLLLEAVAGADLVSSAYKQAILAGTCGTSSETAPSRCPTDREAHPRGRA
jgi:S-adenosylmethionine:tRNA ribosyltransferase-isomerase